MSRVFRVGLLVVIVLLLGAQGAQLSAGDGLSEKGGQEDGGGRVIIEKYYSNYMPNHGGPGCAVGGSGY